MTDLSTEAQGSNCQKIPKNQWNILWFGQSRDFYFLS